MLLHYFGKLKIQIFCRYSAIIPDTEDNADKLYFKFANINSSTRVTVYAECNLRVSIKIIHSSLNTVENFICNQYGEKLAILNTDDVKICGLITKPEATKMQLVCIFFHIC